jgi:hypothetical protein
MTVSSTANRAQFVASGNVNQFDFTFPFGKPSNLRVWLRHPVLGPQEVQAGQYSLTNPGSGPGGRITLQITPVQGTIVTIVRVPDFKQETDFQENAEFYLETVETTFDERTFETQRLADLVSRALVLPDADAAGSGAYVAGGNRITGLGLATQPTDAVRLSQVQSLVGSGGGGGGTVGWPVTPPPQSVVDLIIADPSLQVLFTPINSQIGSLSANLLAVQNANAGIVTSVGTIQTTITSMQSQIATLSAISGDASNIVTLISTETTQRINQDNAIASLIAKIGAADGDNVSFLLNLSTAKVGPTETLSQRFAGIASNLSTNSANIANEITARATADSAISTTISRIGALADAGASFLINLDTAKVGPTETLAQRFSGITSAMNTNAAAITNEISTRAAADGSLAAQITTLQASVSGFNVAIQQNATAINGVQARWTVKVDNNNRISGFGLISEPNNGAIVSTFAINADAFRVFNGASDVAPFTVVGGVVTMQNVRITGDLFVDGTISGGKIINGSLGSEKLPDNSISNFQEGTGSGSFNHTTWTTRATAAITPVAGGSKLKITAFAVAVIGDAATAGTFAQARILRNGTQILGPVVISRIRAAETPFTLFLTNTGLTGAQTYELQMLASATHGLGDPHSVSNARLLVEELVK